MEPSGHGAHFDHSGHSRRAIGREKSSVYDRARLERIDGGQRDLAVAITGIQATLNQLSVESAETRRMMQHVGERLDHRSSSSRHVRLRAEASYEDEPRWTDRRRDDLSRQYSASRHARHRAEDRGGTQREYDDDRGSMRNEARSREGRQSGARIGDRGAAVERWHEEGDQFHISSRRGHYDREHHFEPTYGYDRHRVRDGGDQGRVHYHEQQLEKPKADLPYFAGGHPGDWLDKANYFLHIYEVPREARVGVASFHLEGTARKWWRRLKSQFEHDGRRLGWTHLSMHSWSNGGLHV